MRHQFEIRRLEKPDTSAFLDIRREAIGRHPDAFGTSLSEEATHSDAWYLDKLETDYVLGGFDHTGALVGTVAITTRGTPGRRKTAALSGMYVRPTLRRAGLSRLLLDAAVSRAFQEARSVFLAVTVTNETAIRLYLSAGFREWENHTGSVTLRTVSPPQILMRLDW